MGRDPAGGAGTPRAEGWALLGADGTVYAEPDAAAAVAAMRAAGGAEPVAAAFAVAGESGDTLLPLGNSRPALNGLDPDLPVAVKYLGRWVVVTLAELPAV